VKGKYEAGSVAMANAGPNTNGSQFFNFDGAQCATLPPWYNLFGKATAGIDVVHAIANVPTTTSASGERSRPIRDVILIAVQISEQ
jgi:cyclophilin family peptidyl-prolyl cis-trans isomerase